MRNEIAHIAAADGIDADMHPGTSYPRRPLGCGADLDATFATSVLEMLQAHHADTCCRVAPLVRCLAACRTHVFESEIPVLFKPWESEDRF